ncbi:MAG: hypothetical protein KDC10_11930 [Calditrichaeota bacterium]|nr:hypothetical protein [Calditrichota bacterium]MCB9474443.1 hypothetical protein [Candidatus Delongbacteria bacterium]
MTSIPMTIRCALGALLLNFLAMGGAQADALTKADGPRRSLRQADSQAAPASDAGSLRDGERTGNAPDRVDFQGRLADSGGSPLDSTLSIHFSLYDVETGGTSLWNESVVTEVVGGLFHVLLGAYSPLDASLFSGPNRWIGLTVGDDAEMTPRVRVGAVPYALQAGAGDNMGNHTATQNITLGNRSISGDGDNEGIYISSEGKVGINISNPSTELGIYSLNANLPVGITQNDLGSGYSMDLTTSDELGEQTTRLVLDGGYQPDVSFYRGSHGSEESTLFIEGSNGHVGIGTTNPDAALHVRADSVGDASGLRITQAGYNSLFYHDEVGSLIMRKFNQTDQLVLGSTGNVGVGTTTPNTKFEVAGTATVDALAFPDGTALASASGVVTLGSGNFIAMNSSSTVITNYASGQGGSYMSSGNVPLVAALQLPQGATVTRVKLYVYDTSALNLSAIVAGKILGTSSSVTLANLTVNTSSGHGSAETQTINEPLVDNLTHQYVVTVQPNGNWPAGGVLSVTGVTVEWEMQ